ncbi:hypothetical protein BC567DRAFT_237984 [Phyllosticta citribraziliensis]
MVATCFLQHPAPLSRTLQPSPTLSRTSVLNPSPKSVPVPPGHNHFKTASTPAASLHILRRPWSAHHRGVKLSLGAVPARGACFAQGRRLFWLVKAGMRLPLALAKYIPLRVRCVSPAHSREAAMAERKPSLRALCPPGRPSLQVRYTPPTSAPLLGLVTSASLDCSATACLTTWLSGVVGAAVCVLQCYPRVGDHSPCSLYALGPDVPTRCSVNAVKPLTSHVTFLHNRRDYFPCAIAYRRVDLAQSTGPYNTQRVRPRVRRPMCARTAQNSGKLLDPISLRP